jgi:glycerate 2-kinase
MNDAHTRQMKHILRALFHYTIEELDLVSALDRAWRDFDPALRETISDASGEDGRLTCCAFGKAAVPMAAWLLDKMDRHHVRGVLSAPSVPEHNWHGLECFAAGHPVPNQASIDAARTALDLAHRATQRDLIVFLVSGGGSSLFEMPLYDDIPLIDVSTLYGVLVLCGADIVEVNTVRKHLSAVKGGRLAAAAAPARQITLYVSDVPAGQESSIASGPTMPDASTLRDFRRIATKYQLQKESPPSIVPLLGADAPLPETLKPGDAAFDRSTWTCVLDNNDAIQAACRFAVSEGWSAVPDVSVDDVDVATAAQQLLARLLSLQSSSADNRPVCVVSGGELSAPVRGTGVGGRNQAFVLECVPRIAGKRIAVLSAGTDGVDGNSPAAGAVADGRTLSRARSFRFEPAEFLERSDSHTFFDTLGDVITCGPTQNNVRDLRVLVAW